MATPLQLKRRHGNEHLLHRASTLGYRRRLHSSLEQRPVAGDAESRNLLRPQCGNEDAHVTLTLYFEDRDPVGPYRITVPARRTCHLRFNDLQDPAQVPRGTGFATLIESDQPIIVQHTRLDSRQPANSIMTTIAHPL